MSVASTAPESTSARQAKGVSLHAARSLWASPLRRREAIDGFVFILPWLLGLIIFTIGPFLSGLYFSMTEYDGLRDPVWIGFENYRRIFFEDRKFWLSIYNTVY